MQRAKSFLFVSLGILALAIAYHFGATTATAQAPGNPVVAAGSNDVVFTANGDVYYNYGSILTTWTLMGNIFSGPTPAQQESWGSVKSRYLSSDAARSGQASRPRR